MSQVSRLTSLLSRVFGQSLAEIAGLTNRHSHRRSPVRRSRRASSRIQSLEDRALLAVFTVTTTADSGPGSLRDAITQANVDLAADTIEFNIPGPGPHTIHPLTPLPAFASRILVDGFSQPSYAGTPRIFLDGSVASGAAFVLPRTGNWPAGSEIRGLAIGNWSGAAIDIQTSGVTVVGNYIGTDASGQVAAPNGVGVSLFWAGVNNRIGTNGDGISDSQEGNVISSNNTDGIRFTNFPHGAVNLTTIAGNKIGVAADGVSPLGNGGHGINLRGAANTTIGGDSPVERNIISGNTGFGIAVVADGFQRISWGNVVRGNYIGTDASGTIAVPNQTGGVLVGSGALDTTIGVPGSGNLISGNNGQGISINVADGVKIQSNWIGLDATGTATLGNELNGVSIPAVSTNITIGTNSDGVDDEQEGNVISGNFNGINQFRGSSVVAGNKIGTDPTGLIDLGNQRTGIVVNGGLIQIGMPGAVGRNIISGNAVSGIVVGFDAGVVVQNNYIGLGIDGATPLQNDGFGIQVDSATANILIGTDGDGILDANEGNVISGNTSSGISLTGGASGSVIAGNIIGLNATGTDMIPNLISGIFVSGGAGGNTRIGTNGDGISDNLERNLISGNEVAGVVVTGRAATAAPDTVTIAGNYVGTDITGTMSIPNGRNGGAGIWLGHGAHRNVIGTNGDGFGDEVEGNLISGNTGWNAIFIEGVGTDDNVIAGNLIGTDATGTLALSNRGAGIEIKDDASNNLIGTNADGVSDLLERNVISANGDGVVIWTQFGGTPTANTVAGNFIGTDITGTQDRGNNGRGVWIRSGAHTNIIGTNGDGINDEVERNIISGNNFRGIQIEGIGSDNNTVAGNYIGTDVTGMLPLQNLQQGIAINAGAKNTIVGTDGDGVGDAYEGNVIATSQFFGVIAIDVGTDGTIIAGNIIGLNAAGTAPLGNSAGVQVSGGATLSRVGTNSDGVSDELERNVVSGNSSFGIRISGAATSNNIVAGNYVGVDITGTIAIGNSSNGIQVDAGASNNRIGGASASARNLVAGNTQHGIAVAGAGTTANSIFGNYVGTDFTGTMPVSNQSSGIVANEGASDNYIGTNGDGVDDAMEGNLVSGNTLLGIWVNGIGTDRNRVSGNLVGTSASGTFAIANGIDGVSIDSGAQRNILGTDGDGVSDFLERNVISGNAAGGVSVGRDAAPWFGAGTNLNVVAGNFIGTDISGTAPIPNQMFGVSILDEAASNSVAKNVIAGNAGHGVIINNAPNNLVTGNSIGVAADGLAPVANAGHGIHLRGATNTMIGGDLDVERNIISGNANFGVAVLADNFARISSGTTLRGNFIGTDSSGTIAVPNQSGGVLVDGGALNTTIGVPENGNLISGNTGPGIRLKSASGIRIASNFIGTDFSGTAALPNQDGIDANNSSIESLVIGTNGDGVQDALEGNLVSGNLGFGIVFGGAGNIVAGNIIGLDVTGNRTLPNRKWGIVASNSNGAAGPLIGTNADGVSDSLERNIISTNTQGQVFLSNGAARVTIAGNYVGTNAAGNSAFPDQASGIQGSFQQNARIGGGRAGEGNLISGNNVGVEVNSATSSVPVIVAGNRIGTDATGLNAIPNNIGVRVSEWVIIGTDGDGLLDASEGNVISGNSGQGVLASNGSRVSGNLIGLGADGIKPLGNGSEGIFVDNATLSLQTIIGTNSDGFSDDHEGNVIGYNQFGIITERGDTSIRGNYIGTTPDGLAVPNAYDGIRTRDRNGERVDIGGPGLFDRNVIRFNSRYGISNFSNSGGTFLNAFGQSNIIAQNIAGAIGFSIENSEARGDRNFPVFTSLAINGDLLTAEGFARAGQTIELYESGPTTNGFGEGRSLLATFVEGSAGDQDASTGAYGPIVNGVYVGTDTTNRFRFVVPVPDGLNEGMLLASLGAASNGAMSVFSPSFLFGELGSSLAPEIGLIPDVMVAPGDSLLQRGSFVDPDSVAWTATVNYGDGTGLRALQMLDDFQFDLEHQYTTPGTYTVTVSITDNSLLSATRTFTVNVENDTPEAAFYTFNLTSPIVEGDTATLTGEFSDALSSGSYFVDIDWGNGQTSTIPLGRSDRQFRATHVYRDDFNSSGSATAADVYEVSVTIREVGGNSDPAPAGVLLIEVQNSVPTIVTSNFSSTSINEGDTVTLDLSFDDLGLDDTHEIKVDWGDGFVQIFTPTVGVRSLSNLSHTYLDTPRNGDSAYIVSIELTDDDEPLNPVLLTQAITVTSPAPTNVVVNNETGVASINEGDLFTIGGSFTGSGSLDSHLVIIDWGDGRGQTSFDLPAGVTSFSGITHQYIDHPAAVTEYTITVRVADTDNRDLFGVGTLNVLVHNVAPVLGTPQFNNPSALEGDTVFLSGSYSDVGLDDRHTVIVTWADGTQSEALVDSTTRTYQASHTYRDNAALPDMIYNVSVTITDDGRLADTRNVDLEVINVAPQVEFLPAPNQNNALAIELWPSVFDPGLDDTFTYAWEAIATDQLAQTGDLSIFTIDRSAAPNAVFLVTLFVTDSDGWFGSYSLEVLVGTSNADNIVLDNSSFVGGTDGVLILGLGGDDIIDATGVTDPSIRLILDGGSGQDILFGGSGDDIYILADGDDAANAYPSGVVAISPITPNTAGNDRYILTPNSTLTVFDDQGGNALDFERASFGITYDLAAVSLTAMASQDVAPGGTEPNTHFVAAQGRFAGLVGSTFGDDLTAASNSTVSSGAGNDTLRVKSNTVGATFHAGADNDVLFVSGTGISNLSFNGDAGLDSLINTGSIAGLTFSGGADADILQNLGTITSVLNFSGDAGLDILTNSGSIAELTFNGGADRDIFVNNGTVPTTLNFGGDADILLNGVGTVGTLNFGGDSGADIFVNLSTISTLTFRGGADDDIFVNNGTAISSLNFGGDTDVLLQGAGSIGSLSFSGDDGADSLLNFGTVSTLTFSGGADNDVLHNTGTITTSLNFGGDSGLDALLNSGSIANLTFNGGADADIFLNNGTAVTSLNFGGDSEILVAGTGSVGTLNFNGDGGADLLVNLSTISSLTFNGGADNDTLINHGALTTTLSFGGDADILLNGTGSITTLSFNGDGGMDRLINDGAVVSLTFNGGADGDTLINTASNITTLNFGGDGGADVLINSGMNIATLNFSGDEGLDLLTNSGSIGTLVFTGGADADVLRNTGNIFTSLNFSGEAGSDLLLNEGSISGLTFTGGADGDVLINTGTILNTLNFGGDGGSDLLLNQGEIVSLTFTGGADDDILVNRGGSITTLNFGGDSGADSLTNFGTIGSLTFNGGADGDILQNLAGSIGTLVFNGDAGSDVLINRAMVTSLTFVGGADDDRFLNTQDGISILRFFGGGTATSPLSDPSSDGDDLFVNTGRQIQNIEFDGGAGNDVFQNLGGQITSLQMIGGSGDDVFINSGSAIGAIHFIGGDGHDVLVSSGDSIGSIIFTGDDSVSSGADVFILRGTGTGTQSSTVTFTGGRGQDAFHNSATLFSSVTFDGGDENDVLVNTADGIANVSFFGGSGDDIFENRGHNVSNILFQGGAGINLLVNTGNDVSSVEFIGGAQDDLLVNLGRSLSNSTFTGNDGADRFENHGESLSGFVFNGGAGANVFRNHGANLDGFTMIGGDDVDTLINLSGGVDSRNIQLTGHGGDDRLFNAANRVTAVTFIGHAGADGFLNTGSFVSNLTFTGGDGDDILINEGNDVSALTFDGENGRDAFRNTGRRLTASIVRGGAGADTFESLGDAISDINFFGDDDADSLFLRGSSIGTVSFDGGNGNDSLESYAVSISQLTILGGSGNDEVRSHGAVAMLTFFGGSGNDTFTNTARISGSLTFFGEDDEDTLISRGGQIESIVADLGSGHDAVRIADSFVQSIHITTGTGRDAVNILSDGNSLTLATGDERDSIAISGQFAMANVDAGSGDDTIILSGGGNIQVAGGTGDDTYFFVGSQLSSISLIEAFTGSNDTSRDTLNFSSFRGGALNLDLSRTTPQTFGGLSLVLSDGLGIEDVVGTIFGDVITGNARDNFLSGADYSEPFSGPVAARRSLAQWVLLDFDTHTDPGEFQYSPAARQAILDRLSDIYHGPDPQNLWFNIFFTTTAANIPVSEFITVYINQTQESGRPGGLASEIDPGNLNFGGTAVVQINGMVGGIVSSSDAITVNDHSGDAQRDGESSVIFSATDPLGSAKPAGSTANFLQLTSKIIAHEVGHLLGLRHQDSFGPIGFGINITPGVDGFNPLYTGPVGAIETFNHIISSPASVGSTRFDDLKDLYFGEREIIKLVAATSEPSDVLSMETTTPHASISSAQPLTLATLELPNTIARGLNKGDSLSAAYRSVLGRIDLIDDGNGGEISESDFYSFTAKAGDIFTFEVMSNSVAAFGSSANDFIDSILRVYSADGQLVPYYGGFAFNDDIFEPTDSALFDLVLPSDGTYYIEVDTFHRGTLNGLEDPAHPQSPLNPDNPNNLLGHPELLKRFLDSLNDTDTGRYQLIVYAFRDAAATDGTNIITGNGGTDIILGGSSTDTTAPISRVQALPQQATTLTFDVTVIGEDPATGSTAASGVAFYHIYVAVDQGSFAFWRTIPADAPTTSFTAESNRIYWFRSVAEDFAGNIESEPIAPDTHTIVGDLDKPESQIILVTPSNNGLIELTAVGTDFGGGVLQTVEFYVSIDGGAAGLIGTVAAAAQPNGTRAASMVYQGLIDGELHTYAFYSRGIDSRNNVEDAPSVADQILTRQFDPPAQLEAIGIDVQRGANQRSFIQYLDLMFSDSAGLQSLLTNNRIRLERFSLDAADVDFGTGVPVSLGSASVNGNIIQFNFGTQGIGGNRVTDAGNGFYRVSVDSDEDTHFDDQHFEFFRLFGDADGNGIVNAADSTLINGQFGRTGANLDGDIDGDKRVSVFDRLYTSRNVGKKLRLDLFDYLDD